MKNRIAIYLPYLLILLFELIVHPIVGQIRFIENKGQWISKIKYRSDLPGGVLFLEKDCFTFNFHDSEMLNAMHEGPKDQFSPEKLKCHAYKIHFIGSSTNQLLEEQKNTPYFNYYMGSDSTKWVDHAKSYSKIQYENIYPDIDLKIYQKNGSLKYDFKIKPGGNPNLIQLLIDGIEKPQIKNGNLILKTQLGEIIEKPPFAYQLINGILNEIPCKFVLQGHKITFQLGDYDTSHLLTIDPEIVFSSYTGSISDNWGFTATDDNDENLIGGSIVFNIINNGYPTTTGAYDISFNGGDVDVAISKFNADGSMLLFSTYLGGEGSEMPHSMVSDSDNNIIVMGTTGSTNFPTTASAYQTIHAGGPSYNLGAFLPGAIHPNGCDFFVTKFSSDGSLSASTFVGGNDTDGLNHSDLLFHNYGDIFRGEVIVDDNNNIFVASVTESNDFPTQNAAQTTLGGGLDAIGFELNSSLSTLLWASYLGGSNDDAAYSIQLTSTGEKVLTGGTKSSNFPTTAGTADGGYQGSVDGFLTKLNTTGNVIEASLYVSTSSYDQCYFVQTDLNDNIYVIGQTEGNMPIVGSVYNNPNSGQFIRKYNQDLTNIEWSTLIGSGANMDISLSAFLVSDCGQIYFSGWGGSTNSSYAGGNTNGLPITPDAYQSSTDGSDFYLCVLNNDAATLSYATYFGGSTSHEHVDGGTSKFDKNGSVYQAVCAGCGGNDDFPYTPGAWSSNNQSTNCNLGVFKFDLNIIEASVEINGPNEICEGENIPFENYSTGADAYYWTFGDGNDSEEFDPNYQYDSYGEFIITLIASSSQDCVDPDTASINITILQGVDPIADIPAPICPGGTAQLQGYGTDNLHWLPNSQLSDPNIPNPTATVDQETTFYLIDSNSCETDTIAVEVTFFDYSTSISDGATICNGNTTELEATGGGEYSWSPTIGLSNPNIANPIASPTETTTYTVSITTPESCEAEEEVQIEVIDDFPGGNVYEDLNMCINTSIHLEALDGYSWSWTPTETLDNPSIQSPLATPSENTTYYVEVENACGTGIDQVTVYVISPHSEAGDDAVICLKEKIPVWATGGASYLWTPTEYFDDPFSATTLASPPASGNITVIVTDEFGCEAQSEVHIQVLPLPGVNAGGTIIADIAETVQLQGIAEGDSYWWTPSELLSCIECWDPSLAPTEEQWFTLHTIDSNGCKNEDSIFVQLNFPIYVPNTFTPNNDGINDYFRAYGHNIKNFHLKIYNRWGQVVHESSDIDEVWDGSYFGGQYYIPNGVYNWIITYDQKLVQKEIRGHVSIIR